MGLEVIMQRNFPRICTLFSLKYISIKLKRYHLDSIMIMPIIFSASRNALLH